MKEVYVAWVIPAFFFENLQGYLKLRVTNRRLLILCRNHNNRPPLPFFTRSRIRDVMNIRTEINGPEATRSQSYDVDRGVGETIHNS